MEMAVAVKDLSVTLGGQVEALKHIDLELPAGRAIGFIGPSGAGKTTLIRCIVGRLKLPAGRVSVFGRPAGSPDLRRQVSYMTQELSVYPDLTVSQNLAYFVTMSGASRSAVKRLVNEVLAAVDMTDKAGALVSNLSSGQKQRVSLAIALIGSPRLMVLDEPTVGLDPVLRNKLWRLFRHLTEQGTTLIISSHSMDEARRCDDLVLIRAGQVIAHDTPEKIRQRTGTKTIEQSFLKLVGDSE